MVNGERIVTSSLATATRPTVLSLLLDTDVFSYLLKGDTRSVQYAAMLVGHHLVPSFMTGAEVYQWAARHHWGAKRIAGLERELQRYAVISIADIDMCQLWAKIRAARLSAGHPIAPEDAWVAATALRHNLPLVTNNAKDYQGIAGLDVRTATP